MQTISVDTIVLNAKIATMQRLGSFIEAMAIAQGRIVAIGSAQDIRNFAPGAQSIDCEGHTVLPGFIDSHCHPDMHGARLGRWVDLGELEQSKDVLLIRIASDCAGTPAGHWFVGFGYDDIAMGGGANPAGMRRTRQRAVAPYFFIAAMAISVWSTRRQ